jgi:hypothetical protein
LFLLSLIIISLLVYWRWLNFDIFISGDWVFHKSNVKLTFTEITPWSSYINSLGQFNYSLWKLPFNIVYGLFGYLGYDSNVSEKFLIFWPIVLVLPLASFYLTKEVVGSNFGAFIGALILSFNTYFFSINSAGHEFLTVAFGFSIFSIYFFVKYCNYYNNKFFYISIIFLFISSFYDLRSTYLAFIILFTYTLFNTIINRKINLWKYFAIYLAIFTTLSSYWLIPQLFGGSSDSNQVLKRQLFGNEFMDIAHSMTLSHPFWTGEEPAWFQLQNIKWYSFIVPIFAILGLVVNKSNTKIYFFAIITLLGIFLGKQSGEPFTGAYQFLFENIPGFSAFREATKFYFFIALGYSILAAYFFDWLWKKISKKMFLLALFFYIISLGLNVLPLINGDIKTMHIKKYIPDDYLLKNQYYLNLTNYSRILWVPRVPAWEIYDSKRPSVGLANLQSGEWAQFFTNPSLNIDEKMIVGIHGLFFEEIISRASVEYIVVPKYELNEADNFYKYYGHSRDRFLNSISYLPGLELVEEESAGLAVYKNKNFRPHIYITKQPEKLGNKNSIEYINFEAIGNTKFLINISKHLNGLYLNFTDSYDEGWNLYSGEVSWWRIILGLAKPTPLVVHEKSDMGLNSFFISKNVLDHLRHDSTGSDLNVTLYYRPQAFLTFGILISLTAFALIILAIVFNELHLRKHPLNIDKK